MLKLRECLKTKTDKEEKDKQDLVIFSILLLISRLIPSFHMVEATNEKDTTEDATEEQQVETTQEEQKTAAADNTHQRKSREESIKEYTNLISEYCTNGTYFVRKISAQALLPLVKFEQYIPEVQRCFALLIASLEEGGSKKLLLRQNKAHGLMIRINIFTTAYFQYRSIAPKNLTSVGSGSATTLLEQYQE